MLIINLYTVSGYNNLNIFEELLKILSIKKTHHHIMTKMDDNIQISEVIEDFFTSTWLAEDNFDKWKLYTIIFIGEKTKAFEFKNQIVNFLNI